MIRKNSLFCKIIRIKKTSIQLFNESMQSYSWKNETCPWCGSKGSCVFHDTYTRSMTDFMHGKTIYGEACVIRLRCTSCGHTHAILPDVIIPYSVYGLFFILRVLAEYFLHLRTVEGLCARFGISVSMLYRWRGLFLSHKQLWLGVLDSAQTTPSKFIKWLCFLAQYSAFFFLPVCPPFCPVFPAVACKPGKLPPGVFLTPPFLAGFTRHGNSPPGIQGL